MEDHLFKRCKNTVLKSRLNELRDVVKPILESNYLSNFTDHSLTHSDQLCDLVDQLTEPLDEFQLTDDEGFILYATCYLHDIGMQHARSYETKIVQSEMLQYKDRTWNDLDPKTRTEIVRKNHPRISYEMVRQSINSPDPIIGIQLTDDWNPGLIASLCYAHGLDVAGDEYKSYTRDLGSIRMSLLSALLRLADILDESRRRSKLYLQKTRELDLESRMHWWRHYYVAMVDIKPEKHTITLWFDFPPERRQQYRELIEPLQVPWVKEEFDRHSAVLASFNLLWAIEVSEVSEVQSTSKPMDNDLEFYIIEKIAKEKESLVQQERLLLVEHLKTERPTIERALADLRSKENLLSADEQIKEFLKLSKHLWHLGGRRSAWRMLWSEFVRLKSSIDLELGVDIAIQLADMMLQDQHITEAFFVLHNLLDKARSLHDSNPLKYSFFYFLGQAYLQQCAYSQALSILSEALKLTSNQQNQDKITADLNELKLLLGNLDEII